MGDFDQARLEQVRAHLAQSLRPMRLGLAVLPGVGKVQ